jgi:hypothetical protein
MFDANHFKRSVKDWIRSNPEATLNDLQDFCDEQIPVNQYSSYQWLLDQTLDWYKHILAHREISRNYHQDDSDDHSIA